MLSRLCANIVPCFAYFASCQFFFFFCILKKKKRLYVCPHHQMKTTERQYCKITATTRQNIGTKYDKTTSTTRQNVRANTTERHSHLANTTIRQNYRDNTTKFWHQTRQKLLRLHDKCTRQYDRTTKLPR